MFASLNLWVCFCIVKKLICIISFSGCQEGRGGRQIVREFGMDMYTQLYLKWITNRDLLSSTGTLLRVAWQPAGEGSLCIHGWVALLRTWSYHNINWPYSNTNVKGWCILYTTESPVALHFGVQNCIYWHRKMSMSNVSEQGRLQNSM